MSNAASVEAQELPESIVLLEGEDSWLEPGLVFDYIDGLAADLAAILHLGITAEAAYQPGDGTYYGLVFVPLASFQAGRPRVGKEGFPWERHAVRGMKRRDGADEGDGGDFYDPSGFLVCWVEHSVYPIKLVGRGGRQGAVAASYVAEHWNAHGSSAQTLAILLRAVSHHLDKWVAIDAAHADHDERNA